MFTYFQRLPMELRDAIWKLALPEDEPEVCIAHPGMLKKGWKYPRKLFIVYTAYPVLMHICKESRAFTQNFNLSGVRFTTHEGTTARVPIRFFRPDFDTLFVTRASLHDNHDSHLVIDCLAHEPGLDSMIWEVRHLAVATREFPGIITDAIFDVLRELQTITQVFVNSSNDDFNGWTKEGFEAPKRRCKLRNLIHTPAWQREINGWREDDDFLEHVEWYMERFRKELDIHGRRSFREEYLRGPQDYEESAWDPALKEFTGLKLYAKLFVEYEAGNWTEECCNRKLPADTLLAPRQEDWHLQEPENEAGDCDEEVDKEEMEDEGYPDDLVVGQTYDCDWDFDEAIRDVYAQSIDLL
ncbi:hypothetical protein CKAH01_09902 [Colletotrichum kahawae]|uniref:2EXR domain-containing protein n=1 Tax=Colletotrichum kahawae TaxID=34407 RepID=A0AAE0CZR1_COLKA|nr:hypothetical protein CKAH01_09902 [Colletotrichum kahawae]